MEIDTYQVFNSSQSKHEVDSDWFVVVEYRSGIHTVVGQQVLL